MTVDSSNTSVLVPQTGEDDLEELVRKATAFDAWELTANDGSPDVNEDGGLKVLKAYCVHKDPKITVIPNFLSDAEIQHLLELAEEGWTPSTVGSGVYKTNDETKDLQNKQSKNRTSYSCMLRSSQTDLVQNVEHRLAQLAGLNVNCLERLNMVRYAPGQLFNRHHDGRFRPKTVFIYLNDLPDGDGGETYFPNLGVKFVPRKGCAVMWSNVLAPGVDDERTIHQGLPPRTSTKYGVNCFFNDKPLREYEAHNERIREQRAARQGYMGIASVQMIDPARLVKDDLTELRADQIKSFAIHQDPKLRVIPGFLSAEEVQALMSVVMPVDSKSAVDQTSLMRIEQRMSMVANLPLIHMEQLRVAKCTPEMMPHGADVRQEDYTKRFGKTVVYLFLNTVEGGELSFPWLGLQVKPCEGCAVVWSTVSSTGEPMQHQGLPPTSGTRISALGVFREEPVDVRVGKG
eukprot:TRINITY_DN63622_c0_g1_i1.p1 TRINITY_DN63622_c0_g1~~TRINITY_DN63622_c0_g1_i1.p1  ORF type:complete len:460 (-),score=100.95 TRINITY_DN63622_c0_g1_i1:13-1392(-)